MSEEYEFEVWQDDALQAGGSAATAEAVLDEADHYAMMYGQDRPVTVRFYFKQELTREEMKAAIAT